MHDFTLRLVPFPPEAAAGVKGAAVYREEKDQFHIFVNSNLPYSDQLRTLKHELAHIELNHFNTDIPIKKAEYEAEHRADTMTDAEFVHLMTYRKGGDILKHPGGRPRKAVTTTVELPDKSFFTVAEVAEILGVHIHTVQARLRDGTLKGKKLGKEWRIYPDSIRQDSAES